MSTYKNMETKKQEAIRLAYGEYWEESKTHIDNNGWCLSTIAMSLSLSGTQEDSECGYFVRPKSLSGLENNRGWTSILSEDDLPKESVPCFLYDLEKNIGFGSYCGLQKMFKKRFGNEYKEVTHYQPIQKPQPPIF